MYILWGTIPPNKIRKNKPVTYQAKFNSSLTKIANKYKEIAPEFYKLLIRCKCSDPLPNSPYGVVKDHKAD